MCFRIVKNVQKNFFIIIIPWFAYFYFLINQTYIGLNHMTKRASNCILFNHELILCGWSKNRTVIGAKVEMMGMLVTQRQHELCKGKLLLDSSKLLTCGVPPNFPDISIWEKLEIDMCVWSLGFKCQQLWQRQLATDQSTFSF